MSKIKILSLNENLVEKTGDIILNSRDISKNLAIFPNRRPGYFLNLYLYEKKGKPFPAPRILSIDSFVDWAFEKLMSGKKYRNAGDLDLVALLYGDFSGYSMEITGIKPENYTLDFFMPWAFKLLADFEELKINGLRESEIKDFDFLIKEEDEKQGGKLAGLEGMREKYARFSALYGRFYEKCLSAGIYTRSMKYDFVARNAENLDLSGFENVLFAGFFALTASEKKIFRAARKLDNSFFLYCDSPLLEDKLPFKAEFPARTGGLPGKTEIIIRKTSGVHEEIMELKKDLLEAASSGNGKHYLDRESAVVLPDSNMILPLIENALREFDKFNISAGYPLKMTPVYSLLEALFRLLESAAGPAKNRYAVCDYLAFAMHPYVKNLKTAGSAEETRKMFQNLQSGLNDSPFLTRAGLETFEKMSDSPALREIHDRLVRPFEKISDIGDFAGKLASIVDFISGNSTAGLHPYWNYFPAIMSEKLREAAGSALAGISFADRNCYSGFIKTYITGSSHPFRGSPVEGLQCLGFLESRNLKFKNVFVIDVNDEILPSLKKEDTILPYRIRENLKLATYKTAGEIYAYYFENLVFSAGKVRLYYVDDKNREASPFLEKIRWDLEKRGIPVEEKSSVLRINFRKKDPGPAEKTGEMKKILEKKRFSYSSIGKYLECQLAFYYGYILNFREKNEPGTEIQKSEIGKLVHEILSRYFSANIGRKFVPGDYEKEKKDILKAAEAVMRDKFPPEGGLEEYILKSQILRRAGDMLSFHFENHSEAEVLACEKEYAAAMDINGLSVGLTARIDRVDRRPDGICLVDYKTSGDAAKSLPSFKVTEDDLNGNILDWGRAIGSLQLPIYAYVYGAVEKEKHVGASVITLGSKEIRETRFLNSPEEAAGMKIFIKAAGLAVEDILNSASFMPPKDEKPCKYCPYKTLCGRQWVKE